MAWFTPPLKEKKQKPKGLPHKIPEHGQNILISENAEGILSTSVETLSTWAG